MTDTTLDDPLRRVVRSERIAALDVLRGVAILFILLMNMPIMGGYARVSPYDPRLVSWTALDQGAWYGLRLVLEGTQRGLLEVLFGAGMMIMARKGMAPDSPISVADLHFRRNLWLVAFGILHAVVLLWPGDILFAYGLAALFVFPFRTLPPKAKAIVGALFILAAITPGVQRYVERAELQADAAAAQAKVQAGKPLSADEKKAKEEWLKKVDGYEPLAQNKEKQKDVADEKKARLGDLPAYWTLLWEVWNEYNVGPGMYYNFFEIFGTMLLGMALYEWGVVQGRSGAGVYVAMVVVGYGLGMAVRHLANVEALRFRPEPKVGWLTWDIARIALVMGHIGLVSLALRTGVGRRILSVFQAPGRMPLTVYFTASILCMWILYPGFGFGFGLFGRFGLGGLAGIALAIIAVQLVLANAWMAAFESGPADWLWKSLVYWKRQPFRKAARPAEALAAAE